jgi:hypothetical protein
MIERFDAGALASAEQVLARCREWFGPIDVLADHSWEHGESRVLLIRAAGGDVVAKWSRREHNHELELRAYQQFVPALGDCAPRLLQHDDDLRLLVLTRIPGAPPSSDDIADPETHRRAGALFRRLHECAPARTDPGYAGRLLAEFDGWVARGRLTGREICAARELVAGVADVSVPLVPTHYDGTPRNWLIDKGTVRLIDFEWVDWNPWCNDLVKLRRWPWRDNSELGRAFLAGYGKTLDEPHSRILPALEMLSAVFVITWSHEHGMAEHEQSGWNALADVAGSPGRS